MYTILFSLQLLNYRNLETFGGNWSASINMTSLGDIFEDKGTFALSFGKSFQYKNLTIAEAYGTIRSGDALHFYGANLTYGCVYDDTPENLMLLYINTGQKYLAEDYADFYLNTINNTEIEKYNFKEVADAINKSLSNITASIPYLAFQFSFINGTNLTGPFDLPKSIKGEYLLDDANITLEGSMHDMAGYVVEGKCFAVLFGFGVVLSFCAWWSISKNYQSEGQFQQLSLVSFILHVGTDFGLALFMLELGLSLFHFIVVYIFLFIAQITIYFSMQIRILAFLWKSTINIDNEEQMRNAFIRFFVKVTILVSISSISVSLSLSFPYVFLPYVFAYFIPQIYHTYKHPCRKNRDTTFVILITISRLIPLLYFSAYKRNIGEATSIPVAIIFSSLAIITALIVLYQNYVSPTLCKKDVEPQYDMNIAHAAGTECSICITEIEATDEAMTTPCGHSFHRECLQRWMDERLVCPMCRAPLPPLV